uniref:Uncharacterized protein n=1 Tax=viral metagenome TaxID=1070528 RepID=A0A6M3LNA8_9ZZZZ
MCLINEQTPEVSKPIFAICHRTKATSVMKDFHGQIFSAQSHKRDGTTRRWVAKLAKNMEHDRKYPHVLIRDMANGGAVRKLDLSKIDWVANKHQEVYFHE